MENAIFFEMGYEQYLPLIEQWLVEHGFQLSSREWASLAWMVLIAAVIIYFAAIDSKFRHQLIGLFKVAFLSKLAFLWIGYALWIALFILLADYLGYWQPRLTKATLVWSATVGISTLAGFTEAQSLGYFKSAVLNLFRVVIVFEYFIGFATFSIWVEFSLQFLIFFFLVAPIIASDYQQRWRLISLGFFILLLLAMVANSVLAIYTATNLDWRLILREISLPIILTLWVLVLALPLSIYAAYEVVFGKMAILRNKESGLWKAKLGLLLALRHRLKYIREAEKGGAEATRAARADTVRDAYREARKLVDE